MGYILIDGANLIHFADVVINDVYYDIVINDVYYDIDRNIMCNTNSQVTVVSYVYCYIAMRLNLIAKVIIAV